MTSILTYLVALLAMLANTAAQAETRHFAFRGFDVYERGNFAADALLSGKFEASDSNGNGVYELSELTALTILGTSFINCADPNALTPYCAVYAFSFTEGGPLNITASWSFSYQGGSNLVSVHTGGYYNDLIRTDHQSSGRSWYWTDQTELRVSAIPEPSMLPMLGLGLLLFSALRGHVCRHA
jgi:hypothetical protein